MLEDLAPYAIVRGWRAFYLRVCHSRLDDPNIQFWCLVGMGGMHVHQNPAPPAKHRQGAYRPDWVEQGLPEHDEAPVFGCGCGYYGLSAPDLAAATGLNVPYIPIVWGQIVALGPTVLHIDPNTGEDTGFRSHSYQIERLFWPCKDKGLTEAYPVDYVVRDAFGGHQYFYSYQPDLLPIEEILPKIGADLGVEVIRRPVAVWLKEQHSFDSLIRSASEALGESHENRET